MNGIVYVDDFLLFWKNYIARDRLKRLKADLSSSFKEKVEDQTVDIYYVSTEEMVADSLTKAVPGGKTKFCADEMGIKK